MDLNSHYQPGMRFSEVDRDAVAAKLRDAHADGRLSYEEFSLRLDDLYSAATYGELAPILADLRVSRPTVGPIRPPGRPSNHYDSTWRGHRSRPGKWLRIFAICTVIWLVSVIATGHLFPFWPLWVLVAWAVITILRHRASGRRNLPRAG